MSDNPFAESGFQVHTSNTRRIPDDAKNGINLPILRVDNTNYDLEKMTRAQLIQLSVLIEADIANIDMQKDLGINGAWAKPGWEAASTYARKMKSVQVQLIQAELGKRKETVPSVAKFFMDIAYKILGESVFNAISSAAKEQHKLALGAA